MLHLATPTDPHWAAAAVRAMDDLLLDHAHCEKKAASTALNLIFRYATRPAMMVPLARLAREELAHFEVVVEHIRRRGGEFRRLSPSPYAPALLQCVRPQEPLKLLDTLLCCALIEARSCERMQRLAAALRAGEDPALARLYESLLASEARHFDSYVDLARAEAIVDESSLRARLKELAEHEAAVLSAMPAEARMHSSAPQDTT
jgi:tRNA 2-(methylsulfanyl)-N6-isopentenyladenosine37 hydroxylase